MRHPLTLEAFADWLAKEDSATEYTYTNGSECLIHRYFSAVGMQVSIVNGSFWMDWSQNGHSLPAHFDEVSRYGESRKRTYGGALAYLRGLLA